MTDTSPAAEQPEIVHACPPPGSGLTPCCGRSPVELPRGDRISSEEPITCERPRETGQTAPHGPHSPSDAPEGLTTRNRGAQSRTAVRVFWLQRDQDVTVADGVQWPDSTVTIRWRGPRPSTVNWASLDDAMAIHGHGGATRIVWADEPPTYQCACGMDWPDPSLGCGHTFARCESVEGAGIFDPNVIVAPYNGPDSQDNRQDSELDNPADNALTGADRVRTTQDNALREQYAQALHATGGPFDTTTAEDLADAVLSVRDRRMAQLAAGRQTWRAKAEEIERDRDRLATELEQMRTTAVVGMGLHRSAETTVTRVIELAERRAADYPNSDALRALRAALDGAPAEQPAPTTYAEAQQRHIRLLLRRLAARQAFDDAWDRLEEQAIRDLVHLASTDDTTTEH